MAVFVGELDLVQDSSGHHRMALDNGTFLVIQRSLANRQVLDFLCRQKGTFFPILVAVFPGYYFFQELQFFVGNEFRTIDTADLVQG